MMGTTYVPEAGRGVRWDDPAFGIEWPAPPPAGARSPSATRATRTSRREPRARHRARAASSAATRSSRCWRRGHEVHAVSRGPAPPDGPRRSRGTRGPARRRRDRGRAGRARAPAAPRLVRRARALLDLAGEPALGRGQRSRCCARSPRRAGSARCSPGTCAEYDWADGPRASRTARRCAPATLYGAAKHAPARVVARHAAQAGSTLGLGPDLLPLRAGRGRRAGWSPSVARALLRGERAPTTPARSVRDFLHVADVGGGLRGAGGRDVAGRRSTSPRARTARARP